MQGFLGETFDGVISGVTSFGFFVETVLHKCEGLVSVRDLSDYDDFKLDEADYALVGQRTKMKFRMGDAVQIRVAAANLDKRQLDYHWEHSQPAARKKAAGKSAGSRSSAKKRKK